MTIEGAPTTYDARALAPPSLPPSSMIHDTIWTSRDASRQIFAQGRKGYDG